MKNLYLSLILFAVCAVFAFSQTQIPITVTATLPPSPGKIVMTNSIIAPVTQHTRLVAQINSPIQFQLGQFPVDSDVILYVLNPTRSRMSWPNELIVMGQAMPTNAAVVAIVFEEVMGSILASPAVQYVP